MTTTAINQVISDVPPLTCFLHKLQLTRRRAWHIIIACAITILTGGCATSYEPKPDLTSVETIGVILPEASSETLHAEDVIQLYSLTKGEDTVKNSAVGAGAGTATGMVAYLALACSSLPSCGFEWPAVGFVLLGLSGVAGGTVGAVAGATVDTQEQIQIT
jgi:hypothetical protein